MLPAIYIEIDAETNFFQYGLSDSIVMVFMMLCPYNMLFGYSFMYQFYLKKKKQMKGKIWWSGGNTSFFIFPNEVDIKSLFSGFKKVAGLKIELKILNFG